MEDHKSPGFDYEKTTTTPSHKNNNTIELGDIEIRNQPRTEELDLNLTNPEEDDFGGYRIHEEEPGPDHSGRAPNRNDNRIVESDELVDVTPIPINVYVATLTFNILGVCIGIAA
jgi:hypothetical protein